MDILRRNTDYALRIMVDLAMRLEEGPISTKAVSSNMDIPYHLACKLMQRLHKARLVKSTMGPKGGFKLNRKPSKINLLEIIVAIQGPVALNRCLVDVAACTRQSKCPVSRKLAGLQKHLEDFFSGVTLDQLLESNGTTRKTQAGRT